MPHIDVSVCLAISVSSLAQILLDGGELLQRRFKVLDDLSRDDVGVWQVCGLLKRLILEPEDVEIRLVALDQLVMPEGVKALGLLALMAVLGVITGHEIIEVRALEWVFL